jgi:F-type H+-transporting ATPase subunit beta
MDLLYSDLCEDDPATQLDQWQLRDDLSRALALLPETQRLTLLLYHIEGYAYQEIADFLEVPLSTVKKRLFDARRKVQGRMLHMVQDTLQQRKPSQDAAFAQKIQFFLALREADLATMQQLLAQSPALIKAKTEWQMALGLHYWPRGSTALHLAAGMDSSTLVDYLLTHSADCEATSSDGLTPLHMAAMMGATDSAQLLLDQGADPNALAPNGQTPLHHAVLRNHHAVVEALLNAGADPAITDEQQHTAVDWAVIRQNPQMVELLVAHGAQAPVDFTNTAPNPPTPTVAQATDAPTHLLGTVLTSDGSVRTPAQRVNGDYSLAGATLHAASDTPILQTGLKFVDLLAPLARGGQNGIFTALSGVGFVVMIGQIMHSMTIRNGQRNRGCTVWLIQESEQHRAEEQRLNWRELAVDREVIYVTSAHQATATDQHQTVETGLNIANQFQRAGWEVLLLVDSQLAEVAGVLPYLRANAGVTAAAAVTTLIEGHHTPGALPAVYSGLDAVLAFDYIRAINRLYPALDPARSHSTLLDRGLVSPHHRQVATAVKQLLQRYGELRAPMEQYKLTVDDLWYIEDDPNLATEINRARRLDRFLTQPFYGAEPYTGVVGQLVSLEETIAGCQAILEGEVDDLPEAAFAYIGKLEEAAVKTKTLG